MYVLPGLVRNLSGPYREEAASLRMLASLLHTSASPLCVTDAIAEDQPILWVNRVFEQITGYSADEVCCYFNHCFFDGFLQCYAEVVELATNQCCVAIVKVLGRNCRFLQAKPGNKREPSQASTAIGTALAQGRARGTRILNFHKDGSALWNDLTIVPLRNAEGVITHHVSKSFTSAVPRIDIIYFPRPGRATKMLGTIKHRHGSHTALTTLARLMAAQVPATLSWVFLDKKQ